MLQQLIPCCDIGYVQVGLGDRTSVLGGVGLGKLLAGAAGINSDQRMSDVLVGAYRLTMLAPGSMSNA